MLTDQAPELILLITMLNHRLMEKMDSYACYAYRYLFPENIIFQRQYHVSILKMFYLLLFGSENDVFWKIMLDNAKSDPVR